MKGIDTTQLDIELGQLLRQSRLAAGFTQKKLAESVGLSFQQIQKYEIGANRLSVSRLFQLCHVMKVDPTIMIRKIQENGSCASNNSGHSQLNKLLDTSHGRKALQHMVEIDDPAVLEAITSLLEAVRKHAE